MEFDKRRVYTALNADELKAGSLVVLNVTRAPVTSLDKKGLLCYNVSIVLGGGAKPYGVSPLGWSAL